MFVIPSAKTSANALILEQTQVAIIVTEASKEACEGANSKLGTTPPPAPYLGGVVEREKVSLLILIITFYRLCIYHLSWLKNNLFEKASIIFNS